MFAICVFQLSCISKYSFLLVDYLYRPVATSRKSHFVIQSLSSCFLQCKPTEVIHPFFILLPRNMQLYIEASDIQNSKGVILLPSAPAFQTLILHYPSPLWSPCEAPSVLHENVGMYSD